MLWDRSYSATYYMVEVDPMSWGDTFKFNITGGTITRQTDGLMQSADVNCLNYPKDRERIVRIYLDTRQSGQGAHIPLFTGYAVSPDSSINGTWTENRVRCYSVLKPADDVILQRGWFAQEGLECTTLLKQLLKPVRAPLIFADDAPALKTNIVAEAGETNLTMITRILSAVNWEMRVEGDGRIYFGNYSTIPSVIFDPSTFDVIETKIDVSSDWYSCPNCIMVVSGGSAIIYKDESSESRLSIQNRGREVWAYESSVALNANETPDEYARRRLKELQQNIVNASYSRRYIPNIFPNDIVTLHYPSQGLDGDFIVESQSISLGHNARTTEKVIG